MKLRNLALCAAIMIGLTNMVGAAVAQSKIYVINEERVRRDSKVGKEMSTRLGGIRDQGVEKLGLKFVNERGEAALRSQVNKVLKVFTETALKEKWFPEWQSEEELK
jgi:hypothetical protein